MVRRSKMGCIWPNSLWGGGFWCMHCRFFWSYIALEIAKSPDTTDTILIKYCTVYVTLDSFQTPSQTERFQSLSPCSLYGTRCRLTTWIIESSWSSTASSSELHKSWIPWKFNEKPKQSRSVKSSTLLEIHWRCYMNIWILNSVFWN